MTREKQESGESQQSGLTVTSKQSSSHSKKTDPLTYNSLGSPSPTDVIIIHDDDVDNESKKEEEKKKGLGYVVKGSPKGNGVVQSVESCSSSSKGNQHVTLEELGVTLEDLKSMPWEVFDPTWEIRSETMDPWLGGYIKDITSPPPDH